MCDDNEQQKIGPANLLKYSRRRFLADSTAGAGGILLASPWPVVANGRSSSDELRAPSWDDVPTCTASRTDRAGQGPFYIHDGERDDDISLFRQDIRGQYNQDAEPGVEMQLHLRFLNAASESCSNVPVPDMEVYVWHTDAQGYYSGFGDPGEQTPDIRYAGVPSRNDLKGTDRFCRGAGVTDANGVASFRSIFPGWYNGRDIHIHLLTIHPGSKPKGREKYRGGKHILTTQFYFEPEFTDRVHRSAQPYLRRTVLPEYAGAILADEKNNSGLRAKANFENGIVVAQMQVFLDPSESRA